VGLLSKGQYRKDGRDGTLSSRVKEITATESMQRWIKLSMKVPRNYQ
jgi:hypothetical protein